MKISSTVCGMTAAAPTERCIELMAKSGFDAYDISLEAMAKWDKTIHGLKDTPCPYRGKEGLQFARHIRQVGLDNGLVCNQTHAPFPIAHPEIAAYLEQAIECTAELGAPYCVIHPGNHWSIEENTEFFLRLLPFAKSCGVKIATENMWNMSKPDRRIIPAACSDHISFPALLKSVNDSNLVACVDIGHAEMAGLNTSAVEMLHALGEKVQVLHIHDNDKISDLHQLPFTCSIDFAPIVRALKDINYTGYFTLEATDYLEDVREDTLPAYIQRMADAARRLADTFDSL